MRMEDEDRGYPADLAELTDFRATPPGGGEGRIMSAVSVSLDETERNRLESEREESLRHGEDLFRSMANTAPALLWMASSDGLLTFVNDSWLRFTGRALEQELGNGWAEGIHPDDQRCLETYQAAFGARQSFELEYRLRRHDGEYRWLICSGSPHLSPEGTFLGYIGADIDITERKRLEHERAEQAEQLDRIIESIADAVIVYDAQGRTVRTNAAAQQLLGLHTAPPGYYELRAGERVGLYCKRDALGRPLAPQDSPSSRALRGEVLMGSHALDIQLRALDGREVEVNSSAAPLRDEDGQIVGAVGIMRDQTERNQLQRAVSEQARQLEATFAAITDAVILYDGKGNIQRLNPAARDLLVGSLSADYTSRSALERVESVVICDPQGAPLPAEQRPSVRLLRGEVLSGANTQEVLLRLPDGREVAASVAGAPIRDVEGTVIGAVKVVRDETERKRLERERQEARTSELAAREVAQQLDRFFAIASHDIRSPATAIGGFVQLAQARAQLLNERLQVSDSQEAKLLSQLLAALDSADQSGERLQRLVTHLFDTAQAGAGKLTLALAPCDLAALVREHVAAQQVALRSRSLCAELPRQPVSVLADIDRLGQVLTNYLTNALKYSPKDQPITVRLEVREGVATVAVRDHGPGLPPDEQRRVWELYYRAPGVDLQGHVETDSGSLGIGLHVCKRLIELHAGGQVGVESQVGHGSIFWFSLPVTSPLA
jgi:PAS domain S-box-containing protein